MTKFIVITSIFEPTLAVKAFSKLTDYQTVVIGDTKTPFDWHCEHVHFLSVQDQENWDDQFIKKLPYNHYCRKMVGYLHAIKHEAELIIDTDDDNIPQDNWGFPDMSGMFATIVPYQGFINIYSLYTQQKIWARGLPLSLIHKKTEWNTVLSQEECRVGVWQGLANEDADVDAIYRLTSDAPCIFNSRAPVVLGNGTLSPFNSQNTLFTKELFPLLYLPCFVNFRFTDILRGLVAQPIMWLYGYRLGFIDATVVQKRNPHDYFADFISEIPMYRYTEQCVEIANTTIQSNHSIADNLYNTYEGLHKKAIVPKEELELLNLWLNAVI